MRTGYMIYLFIYLITSTIRCRTHNRALLQFMCVLADNPPSPEEVGHATGVYVQVSESAVRRDLQFFVLIREG